LHVALDGRHLRVVGVQHMAELQDALVGRVGVEFVDQLDTGQPVVDDLALRVLHAAHLAPGQRNHGNDDQEEAPQDGTQAVGDAGGEAHVFPSEWRTRHLRIDHPSLDLKEKSAKVAVQAPSDGAP
jgi:hypothetical protein